jgi:hypothetical protein
LSLDTILIVIGRHSSQRFMPARSIVVPPPARATRRRKRWRCRGLAVAPCLDARAAVDASRRLVTAVARRLSITEDDDLSESEGIAMSDCHDGGSAADRGESPGGAAVQLQLRWSAATNHLDVAKQDAH